MQERIQSRQELSQTKQTKKLPPRTILDSYVHSSLQDIILMEDPKSPLEQNRSYFDFVDPGTLVILRF